MYGQNTDVLRESLRELLTFHRIQHRIGGAGPRNVRATTTAEERRLIGEQIARYRHSVLTWCHQGLYAANPHIDHHKPTRRTRGPPENLRHRIHTPLPHDHARLPTLTQLTTPHPQSTRVPSTAFTDCATGATALPAPITTMTSLLARL